MKVHTATIQSTSTSSTQLWVLLPSWMIGALPPQPRRWETSREEGPLPRFACGTSCSRKAVPEFPRTPTCLPISTCQKRTGKLDYRTSITLDPAQKNSFFIAKRTPESENGTYESERIDPIALEPMDVERR